MSWSTWVKAEIDFNRKTYDNKYQVEEDLDELDKLEQLHRDNLMILIGGSPSSFAEKDCEGEDINPLDTVRSKAAEAIDELKGIAIEKFKLSLLLENWDERDGDYIKKEEETDEEYFVDGDPNADSLLDEHLKECLAD